MGLEPTPPPWHGDVLSIDTTNPLVAPTGLEPSISGLRDRRANLYTTEPDLQPSPYGFVLELAGACDPTCRITGAGRTRPRHSAF